MRYINIYIFFHIIYHLRENVVIIVRVVLAGKYDGKHLLMSVPVSVDHFHVPDFCFFPASIKITQQ